MQGRVPGDPSDRAHSEAPRVDANGAPLQPAPDEGSSGDAPTIAVVEETLTVQRRQHESRLRVRKIVHEEPVLVDEPLRAEAVTIERVPFDRVLDAPVDVRREGDVIIVPIVEERLVVERRLVLVEEVRITRRVETRRDPKPVVLRREEAIVERLDAESGLWQAVGPEEAAAMPAVPAESQAASDAAPSDAVAPRVSQGTHLPGTATTPSR